MAWWEPSGPRLIESHLSRDVPWPGGGPQVPGLLGPICPGMSRDVPWPDGGPQVPRLLSPICPGMSHGLVGALRSQAY